jgi:hypothetical protein
VREAVSRDLGRAIKIGRGRSDRGGERLRAVPLLSAAVKSPKLGQARARVVPGSPRLGRGRERHDKLSGGEMATNSRSERGERRGEGLGRAEGTPVKDSSRGEGA